MKLQSVSESEISTVGFGCSSFWAKKAFSERNAIDLVSTAESLGINHFDTGPNYADGEAESRLGIAIREMNRDSLIISTKVGADVDKKIAKTDFSPAALTKSLEGSLRRLGTGYVDILYLWGLNHGELSDDVLTAMDKLKGEGKTRYIAINSFDTPILEQCISLPVDGVMLQYNVVDQSASSIIDEMAKNDKFVICATPLAQSLYNNSTIFSPKLSSVWYLLRALGKHRNDLISARKLSFLKTHPKYSATQLALSFVIKNKNISSSVFGTTNKNHLLDNIGALNIELDIALLNKFESN